MKAEEAHEKERLRIMKDMALAVRAGAWSSDEDFSKFMNYVAEGRDGEAK